MLIAIHEFFANRHGNISALAQAVGRPMGTLARELNPNDLGAKLGAVDLFHLAAASGQGCALMRSLCARAGMCPKVHIRPDQPTLDGECRDDLPYLTDLHLACLSKDRAAAEKAKAELIREIEETFNRAFC